MEHQERGTSGFRLGRPEGGLRGAVPIMVDEIALGEIRDVKAGVFGGAFE